MKTGLHMTEKLTPTTVETPAETAVIDPETLDEGEVTSSETTKEVEDTTASRLLEAKERLRKLLDEREPETDETPEADEPSPEADKTDTDKGEKTPEKKDGRTKKVLRKIGGWAVESLEANGFIPQRGKWHKRNGFTGFIAKTYVWSKQRKAERVAGFLSPEANAQLSGETEEGKTSPEASADDHEDDAKTQRLHRRIGRGALALARGTGRAAKTTYKTYKAIKNVK
jgi:hypothetical protein